MNKVQWEDTRSKVQHKEGAQCNLFWNGDCGGSTERHKEEGRERQSTESAG